MLKKVFLTEHIITSPDYRTFLFRVIEAHSANRKINFSDLSRRAGFSSRSFIKEVIDGKKSLTMKSVSQIKLVFQFSENLGHFFETLVALEHPTVNISRASSEDLNRRLENVRQKLTRQLVRVKSALPNTKTEKLFINLQAPEVYASLGSVDIGATLAEIHQRSGLPIEIVQRVLTHFLNLHVIRYLNGRYFVIDPNLDIFHLGESFNFKSVYINAANNLKKRSEIGLQSHKDLFMHTAFSVSADRLPAMKEKLKKPL